jgi:hypothetical protein
MLEGAQIGRLRWSLLQPVVFDAAKLGHTMAGKSRELPDRIMLCDPEFEPELLANPFGITLLSDEGSSAGLAAIPLLVTGALPEPLDTRTRTKAA